MDKSARMASVTALNQFGETALGLGPMHGVWRVDWATGRRVQQSATLTFTRALLTCRLQR